MAESSAFQRYGQACFRHRGLMLAAAVLLLLVPSPPIRQDAIVTSLVGIAIGVAVHIGIIGAEEHFLHGKFGAADRFNWGRVIDKEFMKPVDWTSATALVSLVALWRADQLDDCPWLLALVAVIVLGRLVLWTAQRKRLAGRAEATGLPEQ